MAFVLGKAQKKSLFQLKEEQILIPGPGAYNYSDNKKNNEHCAPFNTSQVKTSTFEVEQKKYGPGSYEPKYHKDISKQNSKKGYVFASKVQRFLTDHSMDNKSKKQNENKGNKGNKEFQNLQISRAMSQTKNLTTNYTLSPVNEQRNKQMYYQRLEKSKSVMQEIRMKNHENKVQSIKGKRQFIRVLLTSSTNTEHIQSRYVYRNIQGKTLGPGSYQNINLESKPKGVAKWDLNKIDRFKTEPNIVPGPGAYSANQLFENQEQKNEENYVKSRQKKLSAAFASTVIRSHMDSIIYRTNIPIKAAILQDKRFKDSRPGPGSYQTNKDVNMKKDFNYGCETSFGYSERQAIKTDSLKPGPGEYELNQGDIRNRINGRVKQNKIIKEIRNQIFGKKGKITNNYNKNNSLTRSYLNKGLNQSLDDTKSEKDEKEKKVTKYCSLQQRCFSKLGNMSQQQRFKYERKKISAEPGPGEYYNYTDSDFSANEHKNGTSVFKSGTNRNTFNNEIVNTQAPYYNIIRNDIGFKAEKMKRYIENLKKINIQKTPFQTSTKRFKDDEAQINMIMYEFQNEPKRVFSEQKTKQPLSCFKSGTKREVFKSEQKPGPGEYNLKVRSNGGYESVEKKSFNKYYNNTKTMENDEQTKRSSNGFYRKNSKLNRESEKNGKQKVTRQKKQGSKGEVKVQKIEPKQTQPK